MRKSHRFLFKSFKPARINGIADDERLSQLNELR
jgi:hypothetical protein